MEALLEHVEMEPNTGCWLWVGSRTDGGYGRCTRARRSWKAHRLAYVLAGGVIPDGYDLDHLCRVRCCIRPAHLEPVTRLVNLLRGDTDVARKAAQTHCKRGHEFDTANTYHWKRGGRMCRRCHANAEAARKERLRCEVS